MSVKEIEEKYKCSICGNEVIVTKVGGGTLVCCGKEMEPANKSFLEELESEDDEENEEMEDYERKEAEEEEGNQF